MRIAHVIARPVTAPTSGYAIRTWTISRALAQVSDLTIVHVESAADLAEPGTVTLDDGVVVAGEPALAPWILDAAGTRRIVDCQNVESDLWRTLATRGPAEHRSANEHRARACELLERSVLARLDQVWVVSGADAEALAARVPAGAIEVVANVVPSSSR